MFLHMAVVIYSLPDVTIYIYEIDIPQYLYENDFAFMWTLEMVLYINNISIMCSIFK